METLNKLSPSATDALTKLVLVAGFSGNDVYEWAKERGFSGPTIGFESDYQIGMIRARIQALCFELGLESPYRVNENQPPLMMDYDNNASILV
jgi:hypothetical protein